jgi:beta-glucosidase
LAQASREASRRPAVCPGHFEWIYGYGDRFGIIYVDMQLRIPKLSTECFREAARHDSVM